MATFVQLVGLIGQVTSNVNKVMGRMKHHLDIPSVKTTMSNHPTS